jgi:hypothetical protein
MPLLPSVSSVSSVREAWYLIDAVKEIPTGILRVQEEAAS